MGVPELWRFNGREWQILCQAEEGYRECDRTPTFPFLEKADLYRFLEIAWVDEVAAESDFREWVHQQL